MAQLFFSTDKIEILNEPSADVGVYRFVRPPGTTHWVLLAPPGRITRVNGLPTSAHIRSLRDRDRLYLPGIGSALYRDLNKPASVTTYLDAEPVPCARCLHPVTAGTAIVRCPSCDRVHHQAPDRTCWTDVSTCGACPASTAMEPDTGREPDEVAE